MNLTCDWELTIYVVQLTRRFYFLLLSQRRSETKLEHFHDENREQVDEAEQAYHVGSDKSECVHCRLMHPRQLLPCVADCEAVPLPWVPRKLLKLDIARTFDYVSSAFLLEVLRNLGFGRRWRKWISILLSSASTCIMINGTSRPPIWHRKGLRQDDPLSSMLFIIMIDVLNTMIQHAVSTSILQRLTNRHMTSSVSLYADDVVVFCRPDPYDLGAIRVLLSVFGVAFGLMTNYAKCSATPIRCDDDHM